MLRIALLSIIYVLIAIILLLLLNVGLFYFLNELMFPLFNWFNRLHWGVKLILIFGGGFPLLMAFLEVVAKGSSMIGGLIFDRLPQNGFTLITSVVLAVANAIYNIIMMWRHPDHYNFWIVCQLLMLSIFIWTFTMVVIPFKAQQPNKSH